MNQKFLIRKIHITEVKNLQIVETDLTIWRFSLQNENERLRCYKEKHNYLKMKLNPSFLKNFNSGTTLAVNLFRTILSLHEPDLTLGFVKEDWESKLGSAHGSAH